MYFCSGIRATRDLRNRNMLLYNGICQHSGMSSTKQLGRPLVVGVRVQATQAQVLRYAPWEMYCM
jgi:hypothetical protein